MIRGLSNFLLTFSHSKLAARCPDPVSKACEECFEDPNAKKMVQTPSLPLYENYASVYAELQHALLQEQGQPSEEPLQNQIQSQQQESCNQLGTDPQKTAEQWQGCAKVRQQPGQDQMQDHPGETSSQQLGSPPTATDEVRKVSCEDIQRVQNLVEACLKLYMDQNEVVKTLSTNANIEPCFTRLVWQKLEEQNADFFKAYYTRLKLKEQILLFNHLLEQQYQLMAMETVLPPHSGLSSKNLMRTEANFLEPQLPTTNQPHTVSMIGGPGTLCTRQSSYLSHGSVRTEVMDVPSVVESSLFDASSMGNLSFNRSSTRPSSQPFSFNSPMSLGGSFSTSNMARLNGIGSSHIAPYAEHGGLGGMPGSLEQYSMNLGALDLAAEFSNNRGSYSGSRFPTPSMDAFLSSPYQNTGFLCAMPIKIQVKTQIWNLLQSLVMILM